MFNRNKIKELEEKTRNLETQNEYLKTQNKDLEKQKHEKDVFIGDIIGSLKEKNTGIKQVIELTECNTYNNPNILMNKIKEILKAIY